MASLLKQTYMHNLNTMIKLVQIFLFNTNFILQIQKGDHCKYNRANMDITYRSLAKLLQRLFQNNLI